jgi:hypothetical protein
MKYVQKHPPSTVLQRPPITVLGRLQRPSMRKQLSCLCHV